MDVGSGLVSLYMKGPGDLLAIGQLASRERSSLSPVSEAPGGRASRIWKIRGRTRTHCTLDGQGPWAVPGIPTLKGIVPEWCLGLCQPGFMG